MVQGKRTSNELRGAYTSEKQSRERRPAGRHLLDPVVANDSRAISGNQAKKIPANEHCGSELIREARKPMRSRIDAGLEVAFWTLHVGFFRPAVPRTYRFPDRRGVRFVFLFPLGNSDNSPTVFNGGAIRIDTTSKVPSGTTDEQDSNAMIGSLRFVDARRFFFGTIRFLFRLAFVRFSNNLMSSRRDFWVCLCYRPTHRLKRWGYYRVVPNGTKTIRYCDFGRYRALFLDHSLLFRGAFRRFSKHLVSSLSGDFGVWTCAVGPHPLKRLGYCRVSQWDKKTNRAPSPINRKTGNGEMPWRKGKNLRCIHSSVCLNGHVVFSDEGSVAPFITELHLARRLWALHGAGHRSPNKENAGTLKVGGVGGPTFHILFIASFDPRTLPSRCMIKGNSSKMDFMDEFPKFS